jgi:hypothetical protein
MKRRRHTPEPVIRKLREADQLLAEGKGRRRGRAASRDLAPDVSPVAEPVRGMKRDDAKKLKELERENARLKKLSRMSSAGRNKGR